MQVFRFLVILLVISINDGHGYPRVGKKQDLSAEELGDNDNVTGEQLADNVTGEQLSENVTGEQQYEDVTDEQFDENVTLKPISKIIEINKAMHGVTNKDDKVPVPGCKTNSYYWNKCNICHCTEAGSVECTAKTCDEPAGPTKLKKKLKSAQYEKLRGLATGCLPGTQVSGANCECECSIHSVLLCNCTL